MIKFIPHSTYEDELARLKRRESIAIITVSVIAALLIGAALGIAAII